MKLSKKALEILQPKLELLKKNSALFKVVNERNSITESVSYSEIDLSDFDLEKIEFNSKKIYLFQKGWEKQYNINKQNIKDSNDLLKYINIPDEYVAIQRIGYTPKKYALETNSNTIAWFNIDSLNVESYEITDTSSIDERVCFIDYIKELGLNSIKSIPITKNDLLVSFKLTIGRTKIFNENKYAFCNEAIDILTTKLNNCNYWISLQLPNQYNKNTSNAVKGKTLNNELKDKIFIQIPKSLEINGKMFSSFYVQQILSFLIQMETDLPLLLIEKSSNKLNEYREDLLYVLFEKSLYPNEEINTIFEKWKEKNKKEIDFSFEDISFEEKELSKITNYISKKNAEDNELQIYGVTNKFGGKVLKDTEMAKLTKRTKGNKGYKIIKKNDVIYNPSRINIGSIGIMEDEYGVISTLYEIFELNTEINLEYFKNYISSNCFRINVINNMDNQVRPSLKYSEGLEKFIILIPEDLILNDKKYSSSEIQKILSEFIFDETEKLFKLLNTSKNVLMSYKKDLLELLIIEE